MTSQAVDLARRFSGVRRLYGDAGLQRLQAAHVLVIGIGGVGAWSVEALARNAIGQLTLVDLDHLAESNINRQLHALDSTLGLAKVTAMQVRIAQINPHCVVNQIEDFVTPENVASICASQPQVIVDCMDDSKAKVALAAYCKAQHIPLVMVGSAGGKLDATRLKLTDLAHVTGDRMLAKVRTQLRRDHGFAKANDHKKSSRVGITAVYSDEPVAKPDGACETTTPLSGLHCAGYGSSVCVTATAGMIAAQAALSILLAG